jgi:hypothetical protein
MRYQEAIRHHPTRRQSREQARSSAGPSGHHQQSQADKTPPEPKPGGGTEATQRGREAHIGWDPGPGFEKEVILPSGKTNTWHKPHQDTILVVNLQKSQFGEIYYINLGVWVRLLGENEAPKEYQCHIRQRATSLPTEKTKALEQALNFVEAPMTPEERHAVIAEFMRTEAIPLLDSLATLEGIHTAIETQRLRGGMVPENLRGPLSQGR